MQLLYLLASLLASGEVVANPMSDNSVQLFPISDIPDSNTTPTHGKVTLPDGTTLTDWGNHDCWKDPVGPPIASGSSKYANGSCQVCVSQSNPDPSSWPTIGSRHDYEVRVRDSSNHDMGSVNGTLAAFGGETGGMNTVMNMTVGGKQFKLWTMQEPKEPAFAAVYMDWREPGPLDPFAQPLMLYSIVADNSSLGVVGDQSCRDRGASPDHRKVYFQCGFKC